jgi:hypothetical protein
MVGFGSERRGFVGIGVIGEIFGGYGHACTEGHPADGLASVCRIQVVGRAQHRRSGRSDPLVGIGCCRNTSRPHPCRLVHMSARSHASTNAMDRVPGPCPPRLGDIHPKIPKLRKYSLFPLLLESRGCVNQAIQRNWSYPLLLRCVLARK